jgi:hypothetical protein
MVLSSSDRVFQCILLISDLARNIRPDGTSWFTKNFTLALPYA